jgi:hypothetical protein
MDSTNLAEALRLFANDWGIPKNLTLNGALAQVGPHTAFAKHVHEYDIKVHVSAPRSPQQNPAEGIIHELRKKWFHVLHAKSVPKRLWDYGLVWVCEVMQRTVTSMGRL